MYFVDFLKIGVEGKYSAWDFHCAHQTLKLCFSLAALATHLSSILHSFKVGIFMEYVLGNNLWVWNVIFWV
eukprot:Gb_09556 [translate_table: standard]